jgi:hypothetical protein
MKKVIFLVIFLFSFGWAKVFKNHEALYEISYGIIGEVGEGTATFYVKDNHYKIEIKTATKGVAKFLSKGRKDWMVSEGEIHGDVVLPNYFQKHVETTYKSKSKYYTFYHDKKKIVVEEKIVHRVKELTSMDIVMGRKKRDIAFKEHVSSSKKVLPFYVQDDILSLFVNLKVYLGGTFEHIKPKLLYALGGDKKDGHIEIYSPQNSAIRNILGKDGHILAVVINQKIFSSKKGELFIRLDDAGIARNAILKDVVLFGDVTMKLKKLKVY